jgi:hypothetical protein
MGIVSDYLLLSRYINTHLYVVRNEYSKHSHLEAIDNMRKKGNLESTFFIFNDLKGPHFKYGYGYGSKYYKKGYGYKKSYAKASDEPSIDTHLPVSDNEDSKKK